MVELNSICALSASFKMKTIKIIALKFKTTLEHKQTKIRWNFHSLLND